MAINTAMTRELLAKIKELIDGASDPSTALKDSCSLLKDSVPHYEWVGFYMVDPDREEELVLGPYVGASTEHTRIKFGQGICGQAAASGKTFIVDDVSKESNYLSCSLHVKSEIVLPIYRNGLLRGELDIDSHTPTAFDKSDENFLRQVCNLVSGII